MIEIKNKTRGPVSLLVRSKKAKNFTNLVVPGIGAGKNVVLIEDEQFISEVAERIEKLGMISTKYISSKDLSSQKA